MNNPLLNDPQYPQRWSDYIGQPIAKNALQVAAKSARIRKKPLEHALIAHPDPGVGKTALAVLTARELRRGCRVVSDPLTTDQARWLLSEMNDGDVLIADEWHRMFEGSERVWGWLLNYMQDSALMGPLGMERMPSVTIIGTTTEAQKIPPAIVSRLMIVPELTRYTADEGARIAIRMSKAVLGEEGLPCLAKRDALRLSVGAGHNPRAIRRLLTVLRDLTVTGELSKTSSSGYDIDTLLSREGITHDGLDRVAQRYLVVLAQELGGSAGERTIADRLQHAGGLTSVERTLMDRGLVAKTKAGRALTSDGMQRARALLEAVA